MSTPHISTLMEVAPEWIDYNGHMNMAFYSALFDRAADEFYEQIGLGVTQDDADCEVDAVGRGPVDGVPPFRQFIYAEGLIERQGMAGRAPLAVRSSHNDLPHVPEGIGKGQDPGSVNTVIVGNEDEHLAKSAFISDSFSGNKIPANPR